ncbi:SusC/RagA family TonB-linked outer membrane protein [Muricauda sp. 2012CJ35-5]|uniref:SusC/RagA family TonB-linked outer membrane protein n=1 Tax=Flagellimonas spongiicola TaxID=2942208 RepID=A0ABT0PSW7_9FLAO|nr:SusC/RagA family TonB-linked outer membrane protein [Allomuricauda spongiicola]MCL6273832.1 SusC/RagA family TonB-linked outer membrane protein [Allomuricauda spongiicola]
MKFKNLWLMFVFACMCMYTQAQEKTVSGTVTDQNGLPLPGVSVVVMGTTTGTQTDFDGNYSIIANVGQVLRYSYIGQKPIQRTVGSASVINVGLEEDTQALDEVILTGVAQGTSQRKLAFKVETVNPSGVQTVPTPDAASALIGKVAGAQIVRGGGNPLRQSAVILRGASSIEGNSNPLIIVDGIITQGNLNQISTQDIASIEVVKGAAASSLYGSLAGNGVIQIITKRGKTDKPQVKLRFENGFSETQNDYPLARNHDRLLDAQGNFDETSGSIVADPDGIFDNPWPGTLINNVEEFISSQPYSQIGVSVSQNMEKVNYFISAEQTEVQGILRGLDPFKRQNARLNLDLNLTNKFKLELTNYLVRQTGTEVTQQGQGDNVFFNLLTANPTVRLDQKDEDGNFIPFYDGNGFINEYQNPLYVVSNQRFDNVNTRMISSVTGKYSITDDLVLETQVSTDRGRNRFINFFPKGYVSGSQFNANTDNGFIFDIDGDYVRNNSYAQLNYNTSIGEDFNFKSSLRYLFEDIKSSFKRAQSSNFLTEGVTNLQQGTENILIGSGSFREKTQNVFLTADFDWKEKLILGGFVRQDRSSLFGEDNRDQIFWRGSFAYRLGEDLKLEWLDEFKFRGSYGTAGLRPSFGDIFETFNVSQTGITPLQIGNPDLQSPTISELEVGTDIGLFNKLLLSFTYADSKTEDALLTVPLSGAVPGAVQVQNVAETAYEAIEVSLSGTPIQSENFTWDTGVTFATVENTVVSLGDVAPFNRVIQGFAAGGSDVQLDADPAVNVFRVEPGQPYGAMYGNQLVKSLDELTVENGLVINEGLNLPLTDFSVNEFGHVIVTANEDQPGLVNAGGEQAIRKWDADTNQLAVDFIGDTNPDFIMGIRNTFTYKNLRLYTLIDIQSGGDVYNYTRQFLYFNDRHADLDDFGAAGQQSSYANASSTIYNGAAPIDYFVEDASFTKLREVSLTYTLDKNVFGPKIPIDNVQFTLSGRNLYTWTDYSGYDPEVALSGSPIFRMDEFSFPNFRTYAASIQITF